jgi:hypothetical protein
VVARPRDGMVWNFYRLIMKNGIDQITIDKKRIQISNTKKRTAFAVNELGICVMQDDMLVIKDLESFETIRSSISSCMTQIPSSFTAKAVRFFVLDIWMRFLSMVI